MLGQPEKRYAYDGFWFFRFLRTQIAKPCSIFLSLVLLLAGAAFVYKELNADHRSSQPFETNLYSLDGSCDMASAPAESREFRSGREEAAKIFSPKLEARNACQHLEMSVLLVLSGQRISTHASFHRLASPCAAPFSPRPPPLPSAQA